MTVSHSEGDRLSGRLSGLRALACALSLFGACASSRPPAVLPASPSSPLERLQQEIDTLLAPPGLERSTWGVVVRRARSGETLYARNPGTLLIPASAVKLVTLAAAADRLGWQHVFETTLLAAGAIDAGHLDGDLLVVGSGDPSLDDWDGAATRVFTSWAERLEAQGVRSIGGRIVGDDNAFDDERLGQGWTWEDLSASYSAGTGALQINQNSARITIEPAALPGAQAQLVVHPSWSDLQITPDIVTSAIDVEPAIVVRREPGQPRLVIRGSVPAGSAPLVRVVSVDNPTLHFVRALRQALVASGIEVGGQAVDIDETTDAPSRAGAVPLVTHRSPPLRDLAAALMKNSQNMYAETFLKSLGNSAATPASTAAGQARVMQLLAAWDIPPDAIVMADGSGLSRYNLATADALASVLWRVYQRDDLRDPFVSSLPVAGRDGTLARRMSGTPAQDRVVAKTGSFSNARALAGYVHGGADPILFVLLANNFGSAGSQVESTMDAIAVALARYSQR